MLDEQKVDRRDQAEDEDVDEEELEEEQLDDEGGEEPVVAGPDDEDAGEDASLDELLAQRSAARRGTADSDDDEDFMRFATDASSSERGTLTPRVTPLKDRHEFVCSHCHLVKARSQLADPERRLCRDCL